MPLRLSTSRALEAANGNQEATWPARGSQNNRIEPFVTPRWTPKFKIERGQQVFAIGSCFSRNIEKAFAVRGFRLPAWERLKASPEARMFGPHVLNNFGLPSILNELSWALGIRRFDYDKNIVALPDGGHIDLHLNSGLPPVGRDIAIARRHAIASMYSGITDADLAVVVLSDTECWFDLETGLYLNTMPRPAIVEQQPDRFEVHILDPTDKKNTISEILELIASVNCNKVIFQISPSPLTMTYSGDDVAIASFAAKCGLRSAVSTTLKDVEWVDYFPAFEIISQSSRSVWADDLVHVETDMIDRMIAGMISSLVPGGTETQEQKVRRLLTQSLPPPVLFGELEGLVDVMVDHPELALRFTEAAITLGKLAQARSVLELVDGVATTPEGDWVKARLLFAERRFLEASKILELKRTDWVRRTQFWPMLVTCHFELARWADGKAAVNSWAALYPRSAEPYRLGAVFLGKSKQADQILPARHFFEKARILARTSDERTRVSLDYGEFLSSLGRIMAARRALQDVDPSNPPQANRLAELKLALGMR